MSGIAGIISFDGAPIKPGWIEKLTEAMKNRGPDAQTQWGQSSVALGHCMLRTTPESIEERQPLTSNDKKLVLVWDGRLDNREELRRNLLAAGAMVRDNSDAELALQSYASWGEACPQNLLGDFAFAVWDAGRGQLFCTRDHMGGRPFYYTRNDRFFAFASEEEALPLLPGVSGRANEELVACSLVPEFLDIDYWHAWMEDVRVLPPATNLSVSMNGGVKSHTYWQLEPGLESKYSSEEECCEAFLAVFGEAVRCRMRSMGHVSAMLSGGLDSAGIAAMVKRLLPEIPGKQFHTYSVISDHPESCVESRCIQSLTQGHGHNAHFLSIPSVTGMLGVEDLLNTAWSKAHPVDNSILLPELMCLAASRDGHRVMLYGAGGDLTMDNPDRYAAYSLLAGQWRRAWKECRDASLNNTYLRGTSPYLLLLFNLWTAYVPGRIKAYVRKLRAKTMASPLGQSVIRREFAESLRLNERIQAGMKGSIGSLPSVQQLHIQLLQSAHGITSGMMSGDRIAGNYGIEARDPWCDKRLVEFFLHLPLQYKVREGWTKYLVRSGFARDLAPEVRWRLGKEHLGWGLVCRLLDESSDMIAHTMEHGLGGLAKYVDTEAVRRQYADYRAAGSDASRKQIFSIMTLSLWAQQNLR